MGGLRCLLVGECVVGALLISYRRGTREGDFYYLVILVSRSCSGGCSYILYSSAY